MDAEKVNNINAGENYIESGAEFFFCLSPLARTFLQDNGEYQRKRGTTMSYKQRITAHPDVMLGKPVIKDTRITVELILRKLSEGMTIEALLTAYPHVSREDILAALSYSAEVIAGEEMIAP